MLVQEVHPTRSLINRFVFQNSDNSHNGIPSYHVEAWIRSEHPTLDHMSLVELEEAAVIALACAKEAGPEMSEQLAKSFGLNPSLYP